MAPVFKLRFVMVVIGGTACWAQSSSTLEPQTLVGCYSLSADGLPDLPDIVRLDSTVNGPLGDPGEWREAFSISQDRVSRYPFGRWRPVETDSVVVTSLSGYVVFSLRARVHAAEWRGVVHVTSDVAQPFEPLSVTVSPTPCPRGG